MPDPIQTFQQRQQRDLEDAAAQKIHDGVWANQFSSTPSADVLRANLDQTQAINSALEGRMRLDAQHSEEVQRFLYNVQKQKAAEQEYPLQQRLLEERIAHEQALTQAAGAHDAFTQRKDAESMNDLSGFFSSLDEIKAKPGTPEYRSALNQSIRRYPRVIGTQAGRQALENLQREHEDIAAIQPPAGMEMDSVTYDKDGRPKAVFKPVAPAPVDPASVQPKPGFIVGHYVQDSAGKSHAVFVPDPASDPLKAAGQIRGQLRTLDAQARLHDATIEDVRRMKFDEAKTFDEKVQLATQALATAAMVVLAVKHANARDAGIPAERAASMEKAVLRAKQQMDAGDVDAATSTLRGGMASASEETAGQPSEQSQPVATVETPANGQVPSPAAEQERAPVDAASAPTETRTAEKSSGDEHPVGTRIQSDSGTFEKRPGGEWRQVDENGYVIANSRVTGTPDGEVISRPSDGRRPGRRRRRRTWPGGVGRQAHGMAHRWRGRRVDTWNLGRDGGW